MAKEGMEQDGALLTNSKSLNWKPGHFDLMRVAGSLYVAFRLSELTERAVGRAVTSDLWAAPWFWRMGRNLMVGGSP